MHTQGLIVCLPKKSKPQTVNDYRPLALLNTDHKIYARILANRLKLTIHDVLYPTQYSAVPGRNIYDATAALRDIIALGTQMTGSICLIALDFNKAFDNISHQYLQGLLSTYNYGPKLTKAILLLYTNTQSKVNINGHLTRNIPIRCSIRQGCPFSSILYALAINPFLALINDQFRGLQIGTACTSTACIAYADDVTVVIQNEQDIKSLNAVIQLYTQATGASINWNKSSALPIGQWDTHQDIGGVKYSTNTKILGILFGTTIAQTIQNTWIDKINTIRATVHNFYI
jgi:hypothetical protein